MPYEFVEHPAIADVQFRAWGKDLAEAFTAAAAATLDVMVRDIDTVQPRQRRAIALENEALDMLLFDFLQEIIYYKDAEGLLLRMDDVAITEHDGRYRLTADGRGEPLDPQRHEPGADVKAVTLHQFALERDAQGWTARVILDI